MEIEVLVTLIGNFGFPITIALYLLFRFEKTITTLACEIRDLKDIISKESRSLENKVENLEEIVKYKK